jgi:hypothetical protein
MPKKGRTKSKMRLFQPKDEMPGRIQCGGLRRSSPCSRNKDYTLRSSPSARLYSPLLPRPAVPPHHFHFHYHFHSQLRQRHWHQSCRRKLWRAGRSPALPPAIEGTPRSSPEDSRWPVRSDLSIYRWSSHSSGLPRESSSRSSPGSVPGWLWTTMTMMRVSDGAWRTQSRCP